VTSRGDEHRDREVGGVLVGDVCRDEGGPYVRVDATIDALHAEEQGTELTFTHATWDHIHKEMDTRHQGKRIVGWYHTHPGFGIFLSDRDAFIHQSFFNLPYQVALVYDPKSREHGVFVWRDNEPRRARRHWVGEHEHVWDGAPPPRAAEPPPAPAETPMRDAPSTAPAEAPDRLGLLLGGLTVAILGGLVGWIGAQWSAGGELRRLEQQAIAQREVGAEQAFKSLHGELVAVLRDSLGGGAQRAVFDEGIAAIDRALAALPPGAPPSAAEELNAAKRRLDALKSRHEAAERVLLALARDAEGGPGDARTIREMFSVHRAMLGQLCAEVAALTPDRAAARRLLRNAIAVDAGNREIYEKRLKELEQAGR
jgi:proteasome lid subunit RPN8/RPN11